MKPRAAFLPPVPDRPPYIAVTAGEVRYSLRVPSLMTVGLVGQALDRSTLASILGLLAQIAEGRSVLVALELARQRGPEILQLLGVLIGVSWVDPTFELESERPSSWSTTSVAAYGTAVLEELHEAGWTLSWCAALGLALSTEIQRIATLEAEVQEQARFFGRKKAAPNAEKSTQSAPSSAAESAPSES